MNIYFVFLKFVKFVNLFLCTNLIILFNKWAICSAEKLPTQPLFIVLDYRNTTKPLQYPS